jgi:predicted amidohydrolase
MKVAAVQFGPVFRDKPANLRGLSKLVIEASNHGAKLVVLPELSAVGYSFMDPSEAYPFAEDLSWLSNPGAMDKTSSLAIFSKLAHLLDVSIVWGLIEIDAGTKKLYNSQVYYEPSGYYDSYRKVNFFANDHLWASPGVTNPPVIKCQFEEKRIGMLVCRDVRDKKNDKWSDFYSPGDADYVSLSANWGKGGFPSNSWMDFVEENKTGLIVSNRYGVEDNNDFGGGGICIIDPGGKVHCEGLKWHEDCIVYSDI